MLYSSCLSLFLFAALWFTNQFDQREKVNFLEEIPTAGSERQDRVCRSESEQERSDGARGDYAEER